MEKYVDGYGKRYKIFSSGKIYTMKLRRDLSQYTDKFGYKRVSLSKDGESKKFLVHVLMARHFIPNPENKKTVNHKDKGKTNNDVSNLEWSTHREQALHANNPENRGRSIDKMDEDWNIVETYKSLIDAANDLGVAKSMIGYALRQSNKGLTYKGFYWQHSNPREKVEDLSIVREIPEHTDYLISKDGKIYNKKTKLQVVPRINEGGYHFVKLTKDYKACNLSLHRLVAAAYISEPPHSKSIVNHMDNNPYNNHYKNLEWTTKKGNREHAVANGHCKRCKVSQYYLDGEFIKTFDSYSDAARAININVAAIQRAALGKQKTSGGFKWKLVKESE